MSDADKARRGRETVDATNADHRPKSLEACIEQIELVCDAIAALQSTDVPINMPEGAAIWHDLGVLQMRLAELQATKVWFEKNGSKQTHAVEAIERLWSERNASNQTYAIETLERLKSRVEAMLEFAKRPIEGHHRWQAQLSLDASLCCGDLDSLMLALGLPDTHVHDGSKCCECGDVRHCCCDCPIFGSGKLDMLQGRTWKEVYGT